MTDFPDQPKIEGHVIRVAQNKLDPGADALFHKTFMQGGAKSSHNPIITTGQIEALAVPDGWIKRKGVRLPAGAGLVEYHPPGHDDIRLNSFYRGSRISDDAARAFKECLAKPPHDVTPDELQTLSQVLRDKSYDFKGSARTEDLNGKRVLIVQGHYTDKEHTGSQTIYVDSDGTGSAVQEISYTASGQDYQMSLDKAQKAFKSIIWKP
jgi:hypothetical protein